MSLQSLRFCFFSLFLFFISSFSWVAESVTIEDWRGDNIAAKGIPVGWTGQGWGFPDYDMTIVVNEGRKSLHMKSADESSTINKKLRKKIDLQRTPILQWQWKVVVLPTGGDSRGADKLDQAAQIYVSWPRFPRAFRSRIIGYVWDTTVPVGTQIRSPKSHMVTYIVVRSGDAELGKWITEQRNVREDYKRIFGEEPFEPGYISLSIDSNDTDSRAEAFIGTILFHGL
ncbi:MAG: DUF3047 domain-containing protein [Alphaproteobacteria bacterium]